MQTLIYSTRVSRNSLKEKLSKMTVYCEELFSEYERIIAEREKLLSFLCETEKENANMDRLGKSINNRMEGLKSQLEVCPTYTYMVFNKVWYLIIIIIKTANNL